MFDTAFAAGGGFVMQAPSARSEAADIALAKRLGEVLHKHYPGHLWAVSVNSSQGIASILNLRLSGRWGFMLHLRDLSYEDEITREAMQAGGELLERYRLARGAFRESEYEALPTTRLGNLIIDPA